MSAVLQEFLLQKSLEQKDIIGMIKEKYNSNYAMWHLLPKVNFTYWTSISNAAVVAKNKSSMEIHIFTAVSLLNWRLSTAANF